MLLISKSCEGHILNKQTLHPLLTWKSSPKKYTQGITWMVSCISGNKSFLPVKGFRWSTIAKNIRNKFCHFWETNVPCLLPNSASCKKISMKWLAYHRSMGWTILWTRSIRPIFLPGDGDLQCITASQYSQGMVSWCLMPVEQFLHWNHRFEMEYS